MDRRERLSIDGGAPLELILAALDNDRAGLWTALPGIVQSFSAQAMTCVVQPAIQAQLRLPNGTFQLVTLKPLVDVPVIFPSGGGFTLTFPVKQGDECLVVFASRCIDGWWQSGGVQAPIEVRLHDLSDGFALVGPRSQPRVLSAISTTTTQLRSDDGAAYVEIAGGHAVNIVAPGGVTITGNLHVTGAVIAGFGSGDQVGLQTHTHSGVQPGAGSTGAPTAGT